MELSKRFCSVFVAFLVWNLCLGQSPESSQNAIQKTVEKPKALYDYQTRVVAYKDVIESRCLLEILTNEESIISQRLGNSENQISTSNQLSKREVWRLAGTRISDFCRGFPTYLIQNHTSSDNQPLSYMQNDLPTVELTKKRNKRQTRHYFVGKLHGQTQSQYLSFVNQKNNDEPGKAEAESSFEGTKAIVSGTNGMGQAQSQSATVDCGECLERYQRPEEQIPEKISRAEGPGGRHPEALLRPSYPGEDLSYPFGARAPSGSERYYPYGTGRGYDSKHPSDTKGPLEEIPSPKRPGNGPSDYSGHPPEEGAPNYPGSGPRYTPKGPGEQGPTYLPRESGPKPPYPGESQFPGSKRQGQPGGEASAICPPESGTFGGQVTGQYESQSGHSGIFSGTFQGRYESDGHGVGPIGPGELLKPRPPGLRPGSEAPGGYLPGGYPSAYPPGASAYPGGPGERYYPGSVGRPGIGGSYPERQEAKAEHLGIPGEHPQIPEGYPGAPGEYLGGSGTPRGPDSPGRYPSTIRTPPGYPGGTESYPGAPKRPYTPGGYPLGPGGPDITAGYPSGSGGYPGTPGRYPGRSGGPDTPGGYPGRSGGPDTTAGYPGRSGGPDSTAGYPGGTGGYPGTPRRPDIPGGYPGRPEGPDTTAGYPGTPTRPDTLRGYPGGLDYPGTPGTDERYPGSRQYPGRPGEYPGAPQGGYPGADRGYSGGPNAYPATRPSTEGTAGYVPEGKPGYPRGYGPEIPPRAEPVYQPGYGPEAQRYAPGTGPGYQPSYGPGIVPGAPGYSPGAPLEYYRPGTATDAPGYAPTGAAPGPPGYRPGLTSETPGYSPGAVSGYQPGYRPGTSPEVPGYGPGTLPGAAPVGTAGTPGAPGQPSVEYGFPGPAAGPQGPGYGPSGGLQGPGAPGYGFPGGSQLPPSGTPGYGAYPPTGGAGYPSGYGAGPGGVGGYAPGGYGGGVPPGQYIQGGPGVQQGPGQWIDGKWVSSGGGGQGPGQFVDGKWVPSTGGGQWIDGKWVPTGGVSEDDADSQVQTSVHQTNNATIAKAEAHGKFQGGTAQSQVSGTYAGSGSFSASAGSDDGKRGALTQVSGGKEGAKSSAQGRGGTGQSQAEVTLDSDSGDTLSSAQTSGTQHGSQTEVRGSEKGGLADAQANGLGPTSSQAQIGFTPHLENENGNQTSPFNGGGTAAAQSGTNSGMTQTQIMGKFRYGIKYQGAAQAGSGSTAIRNFTEPSGFFKPINFTAAKVNYEHRSKSEQVSLANSTSTSTSRPQRSHSDPSTTTEDFIVTTLESLNSSETSREKLFDMQVQKVDQDEDALVVPNLKSSTAPPDEYDDYGEEEYEDEDDSVIAATKPPAKRMLVQSETVQSPNIVSQNSDHQKQHIVLEPLEDLDATVHQSKGAPLADGDVLQPGQAIPGSSGYHIPAGFRGKVQAIANGPNTYAIGKGSQAQSVTLSPGNGRIFYRKSSNPIYGIVTKSAYKNGHYGTGYSYQPIYHPVGYRVKSGGTVLPNFVTVSKSEGGTASSDSPTKVPNVYYTQSSSCGMFTNSCVYANGRKRCFPVRKTNPDGSPMSC